MSLGTEALQASFEIIRGLYENYNNYRNLKYINRRYLNEICLLIGLRDHIEKSRRLAGYEIVDGYLSNISKKLHKLETKIKNIDNKNIFSKLFYIKGVNKLAEEIAEIVIQLKFLLDIKRELDNSSKMDIANIILDDKGREFWEVNFGSENLFIQTNLFFSAVRLNTDLMGVEIDFLKKIINDDNDKYISAFEFQEWLDFFGDFTVAMRRTIDSLINPFTHDNYDWYHKNVPKNAVRSLLRDYRFIVRKHTTQKGVFIINYLLVNDFIGSVFIRNQNNLYYLETFPDITPFELEFYKFINLQSAENLMLFIRAISRILDPQNGDSEISAEWESVRSSMTDQQSSRTTIGGFEIPFVDDIKEKINPISLIGNFTSIFNLKKKN